MGAKLPYGYDFESQTIQKKFGTLFPHLRNKSFRLNDLLISLSGSELEDMNFVSCSPTMMTLRK